MGKTPVRMKAVVYALSPFQQQVMPGLWKNLTGKLHHKITENWINATLLLTPVVDKHLELLAKQHIETRFMKINAEKSPFLAEKLKIVVLPTLALIKNAKVDDYVVGFNELGGTDGFTTEELEERLAKAQVLLLEGESAFNASKTSTSTRSVRQSRNADSSDSD
ncbi:hypothetical protein GIB67_010479 [Kingdonia uniflora]|uniref:Thioredoxin-like protein n=1 Tax=Kingdonia uniflora TaxID=39325 RepID=A0A7J7MAJ0_9MAGN|nr:hypothetical protein GIB67_010479 [Kingdonia uniflora]